MDKKIYRKVLRKWADGSTNITKVLPGWTVKSTKYNQCVTETGGWNDGNAARNRLEVVLTR